MLSSINLIMPVNKMHSENQLRSKSKYKRLESKIAKVLGNNIDGTPVSYKVYMTSDINGGRWRTVAFARTPPDGSDDR